MENGDEKNTMKNRRGNGKRFSSPFFLKKCENGFRERAFLENLIFFPLTFPCKPNMRKI